MFDCKACESDMNALLTTFKCQIHNHVSSECASCRKHHHLYHYRFHPAIEECSDCQILKSIREQEEKLKRKREGIEKRRQTMAAKKKIYTGSF